MNPLLDESFHIPWSGLKPENVVPDMTLALERAESEMETIRNMPPDEVDFRNVPLRFCKAQEDLGEAIALYDREYEMPADLKREAKKWADTRTWAMDARTLMFCSAMWPAELQDIGGSSFFRYRELDPPGYIKMDTELLCALASASHQMDIKPLILLTCRDIF